MFRSRTEQPRRFRIAAPRVIAATLTALVVSGCTPGPIDVADSSLLKGLVAHWSLDDDTGSLTARDTSGQRHDGVMVGGTWTAGHFRGAAHLELGDQITVFSFPAARPAYSVALWVRPTAEDFVAPFATLLSTETPLLAATATDPARLGGGWQMNLTTVAGVGRYQFGYWLGPSVGDYYVHNCACAIPDQWTHIAGVVDGVAGTLSFYLNGILKGPGVYAAGTVTDRRIKPGSNILYMGRWAQDAGRLFSGDLDDIVIYDRALTDAEVAALYNSAARDPP
jgi:Concanavalin A-like lectin/glucanases superfamily